MTIAIRMAAVEDAAVIGRLAAELARHQGEPVCRLDAEAVRRDGFGPNRAFDCLLAAWEGKTAGYALVLPWYEPAMAARGLYIADLYVQPDTRGRGLGKALVSAAAAEARRRGFSFVGWLSKPWNDAAHAFYRHLGAIHEPVVAHAVFGDAFEGLAGEEDRQ